MNAQTSISDGYLISAIHDLIMSIFLSRTDLVSLIFILITTKVDFCNAAYTRMPLKKTQRLHQIIAIKHLYTSSIENTCSLDGVPKNKKKERKTVINKYKII
uniref:Uncharacterized protein n=1 Tax=Micrurus carvalhoi TaxID=3147026 RepID=A0A2H6MVQ8_9SAUR